MSGCTAILHRAGRPDEAIESAPVRAGFEFWYRRKRGTPDGPMQITLVCPGYWAVTTKTFEWHPKVLDEWDCNPVEVGTITLPKHPRTQKPAP